LKSPNHEGGFYFDVIVRQPPLAEQELNSDDNTEEFTPISEADLAYFEHQVEQLNRETDKAIFAGFCFSSFGDIALVPAPWLKNPKGIRDIEEWYISTVARRDYVYRVFERQCEVALANLEKLHRRLGNKVQVTLITGTDFGAQNSLFISKRSYRDLFKPFHKAINDWLHKNTGWKTFIHSCGSVVKAEVRERVEIFGRGGGFVFSAVHNIQAGVPVENLMAMFEAFRECR